MTGKFAAPAYAWTCHACQHANAAGRADCMQCGFSARASQNEIDKATASTAIAASPSTLGIFLLELIAWFSATMSLRIGVDSWPARPTFALLFVTALCAYAGVMLTRIRKQSQI